MALPYPDFFNPREVGALYIERSATVAEQAESYARRHAVRPAADDRHRVAVLGVDVQVAFCLPGGGLFVPGAIEDTTRALKWLYGNVDKVTGLYLSLDTHRTFQIFHRAWWVDRSGEHPEPFTPIYAEEVRAGKWRAVLHPEESLEYCEKLERTGKYVLTLWPYHALLGGITHALVPAVTEAALFHSLVRHRQTHFEVKGTHPLTENYSVLSTEVQELRGQTVGGFNEALLQELLSYDRVYVFGEAKSHCVRATLLDMRDRILATRPKLADKLWILTDAMSPVPPPPIEPLPPALDFPRVADETMRELRRSGMHLTTTSKPIGV